jgi:hypothetical protein
MVTRVYRLEIVYPEGSRVPGWEPYAWRVMSRRQRRKLPPVFKWPRERQFLSSSGAYGRAALLRAFGAEVEVYASAPVTWPNLDDWATFGEDSWERGPTAAVWSPEPGWMTDYRDKQATGRVRRLLEEAS